MLEALQYSMTGLLYTDLMQCKYQPHVFFTLWSAHTMGSSHHGFLTPRVAHTTGCSHHGLLTPRAAHATGCSRHGLLTPRAAHATGCLHHGLLTLGCFSNLCQRHCSSFRTGGTEKSLLPYVL
ncbi:hypothetical protein OTU49_005214, partial [Cherax quadricarinatus]